MFWEDTGMYTGEVSAEMLAEIGCKYVILGHSDRRKYLFENYVVGGANRLAFAAAKSVAENPGAISMLFNILRTTLHENNLPGKRD